MFKLNKIIGLILLILIFLIVIPSSFAHENGTVMTIDDENENPIEINHDKNILMGSNDYYFNASAEKDGDGSINNPYKYLTAKKIKDNSNIYLADGEYELDTTKSIQQVNFIGNGAENTILRFDGVAFKVWNSLTLTNLTIDGATVFNYAKLNATNTVFSYGYGPHQYDSYGNNFGGAINCPYYSDSYTPIVHIKNCTFEDNRAEYGGAIYMEGGSLDIIDTIFNNNWAINYGGSIACEDGTKVSISKSKFFNSKSLADAGGAIYLRSSSLTVDDVEIIGASATFGGAITSLNTDVRLSYLKVFNSTAEWDGGAIYHMYGNFSSIYGNFFNNSAKNGGALFIDNSTELFLRNNNFDSNHASYCAGAVYSLCNNLNSAYSVRQFNNFKNNSAVFRNDEYVSYSINLNIGNGNYVMYKYNETVIGELPSYYSLRDYNLVTIPKDQQSSGNCWAFTALTVLESAILKAGGPYLDLSEENMKNLIEKYSDYGWKMETNNGGYDEMPWGYLVSWLGPVLESDDAFDDHSTLSPVLDSVAHVQNIIFLKREDYLDNNGIKESIMKYGAVGTSMLYDNSYFRGKGYYCWYNNYANHAVTIVGWDDNYSASNFYGLPQGDGAWIVRNSWGSDWKDGGYFYVSYYDVKFAQVGVENVAYTIVLNDTIRYDKNYQYDIGGMTDYFYTGDSELWYKNVFQTDSDEFLAGVSTYFEKITNWTASIFVNGDLKLTKQGTSNPGYYTIDLGKFIPLKAGDTFEVQFNVSGSDVASVPISEYYSLNKELYKPGISFISADGQNWDDFYSKTGKYSTHTYYSQVACIKAFTYKNIINTTLSLNVSDDFNITAKVIDQYGNILNAGNVTFDINGVVYNLTINNGCAVLANFAFNQFNNTIMATFDQIGYNSSADIKTLDVEKINVNLALSVSKILNNVTLFLESSIKFNEKLTVKINDKYYDVDFLNGKGYLNLTDLENNLYEVEVIYNESSLYKFEDLYDSFTIDVKKTKIISSDFVTLENSNELFNVTLIDENNMAMPNKELIIVLNNIALVKTTDLAGIVSIPINLTKGNYPVEIAFDGDSNYFSVTKSNNIKVLVNTTIDFGIEKYLNDVVLNAILPDGASGIVSVFIDGKNTSEVYTAGGNVNISLGDIEFKNYVVEVRYSGDDNYTSASIVKNIAIDKFIPNMTADFVEINEGETATIVIGIDNESTGIILLDAGEKRYFDYISSGSVVFDVDGLTAGNYSFNIIYLGDSKYENANITVNVTVNAKKAIEPVIPEINMSVYNDGVNVSLPADATGNISVLLDGKKFGEYEVINGSVVVILGELACGNHFVEVRYSGDENYTNASTSKEVTVVKLTVNITAESVEIIEGETAVINVSVDDGATGVVLVDVGGNKYYADVIGGNATVNVIGLVAGNYSAEITYLGDDKYGEANATVGLNVVAIPEPVNPKINITVSRIKVGEEATAIVELPENASGNVVALVNGKNVAALIVSGGIVELSLGELFAGIHAVEVVYSGNDKYARCSSYQDIIVDKLTADITAESVEIIEGEIAKLNITVDTDATGVVLVDVGGNKYYADVIGGNATVNVIGLTNGTYNAKITYQGDAKYAVANCTVVVKVNARSVVPEPKVPDFNVTVSDGCVGVILPSDAAGSVVVFVDGRKISEVPVINGFANVSLSDLATGNHVVEVRYSGDDNYTGISTIEGVNISKLTSEINAHDVEITQYETATLNVTVDSAATGVVLVDINGARFYGDVYNGKALIDIVGLVNGSYQARVIYMGDERFAQAVTFANVKVNALPVCKVETSIAITEINGNNIVGVLKDSNGKGISNAEVKYVIGSNISSLTTAEDGSFVIKSQSGVPISIVYDGDNNTEATNVTITIEKPISPGPVEVTATKFDFESVLFIKGYAVDTKAGEQGIEFITSLLDANGKPVINRTVQLAVNSKVYDQITNSTGGVHYYLNMVKAGRYTMTYVFLGDGEYGSCLASACVDLDKKPLSISASAKTFKATASAKKYTITVKTIVGSSADGRPHLREGKKVTLKLNGKTYTGKTNADGQVTFNLKINKKGKYAAFINIDEDNTYSSASKTVKITIK